MRMDGAGFHQRDPGPLQMEAGSCLTQLRSTQRAVKAHHRHTLLQSIPYSLLTECVSATHSSVLNGKKVKEIKEQKICVFSDHVHISLFAFCCHFLCGVFMYK